MSSYLLITVFLLATPLWFPVVKEVILDIIDATRDGEPRGPSTMLGVPDRTPHERSTLRSPKHWSNRGWDSGRTRLAPGKKTSTGFRRDAREGRRRSGGFREPGT